MRKKKGQIQNLQPIVIALVSIALVLVIGFLILAEIKSQSSDIEENTLCSGSLTFNKTSALCYNSTGATFAANLTATFNGTSETISALADIPGWLPIIVITVIGALLLGLVAYFRGR